MNQKITEIQEMMVYGKSKKSLNQGYLLMKTNLHNKDYLCFYKNNNFLSQRGLEEVLMTNLHNKDGLRFY